MQKKVFLPGTEEIRGRLGAGFGPKVEEGFAPFLFRHAGMAKDAREIALMFVEEASAAVSVSPSLGPEIFGLIPEFIDAIVDDLEVAVFAKAIFVCVPHEASH